MLDATHRLASALRSLQPEPPEIPVGVHKLTPDGRFWLLRAEQWWPLDDAALQTLWAARLGPSAGCIIQGDFGFATR